jgi:tetratricopeptide (TPR) repeat protein
MTGGPTGEQAGIAADFLWRYLEDRSSGRPLELSEYQARYPGYEDVIAREFARLQDLPEGAARDGSETRLLGPYRLVRALGRGGQGEVWLAEDSRLGRRVALKLLRGFAAAPPDALRRFQREAEIASRLDHPGICAVYETGIWDGLPYIAMRYVEGETLALRIAAARDAGPPARAEIEGTVRLFEAAARAVHAAHEAGVIHRDLKPGNVVVTPSGDPVILDFGLARSEEGDASALTRTGDVFGTPHYMAPEQLQRDGTVVDRRTDVYALGVSLYETLTRRRPFEAPTREALAREILTSEPPDPRRAGIPIPRDLSVVLETALAKEPDRRYQTALDLAEELRRVRVHEPIRARRTGPLLRLGRWARRRPAQAVAVALVLALVGLAGFLAARYPDLRAAQAERRRERIERLLEEGFLESTHGSGERARAAFDAALRLDPASTEAIAGIAMAHWHEGRHQDGLDGLAAHPESAAHPALIRLRAGLLKALGETERAKAELASLGERSDPLSLYLQGESELMRFHEETEPEAPRAALEAFSRCVMAASPARRLYHFGLAHALGHSNERLWAHSLADTLVRRWPDSGLTWYWAGFALEDVDAAGAARAFEESLRLRPGAADAMAHLGSAYYGMNRLEDSLRVLEEARRTDPRNALVGPRLATTLLQMGNLPAAIAVAEDTLKGDRHSPALWMQLGRALLERGEPARAEAALKKAVEQGPKMGDPHFFLAMSQVEQGRIGDAIESFRGALVARPDFPEARCNLGNALYIEGHVEEAWKTLRESMLRSPGHAESRFTLARVLAGRGELDGAIESYRETLRLAPDDPEALCNLGLVLRQKGRFAESRDVLRRGHQVGSKTKGWGYPSAQWLREADRFVALERKLPAVLEGDAEAKGAEERAQLAEAALYLGRWRASARLFRAAFEESPKLMADPWTGLRVLAAGAAARVAAGDVEGVEAAERDRWRVQALEWLEGELEAWEGTANVGRPPKGRIRQRLARWRFDPALASLREPERTASLAEADRARCRTLWDSYEALLRGL